MACHVQAQVYLEGNVWRGKGGGSTAIQPSTVVQDQLKILYGVCIAHIHEGL